MMEIPWKTVEQPDKGQEAVVMASKFQLTSAWRAPRFLVHSLRLRRQALAAPGVLGVSLRAQPLKGTFWTLSAWTDRKALTTYSRTDPHATARDRIRPWMKESTFCFWEIPIEELPGDPAALWASGERRIAEKQ